MHTSLLPHMADPVGFVEAKPQLEVGGCGLTYKHVAEVNGDANRFTSGSDGPAEETVPSHDVGSKTINPLAQHPVRKVVTGLPRSQTFTRKLSEQRQRLEPIETTADERRTASMDQRSAGVGNLLGTLDAGASSGEVAGRSISSLNDYFLNEHGDSNLNEETSNSSYFDPASQYSNNVLRADAVSMPENVSMTATQYDAMIADELERKWILNLSMHYRDRSRREKFFVTYRKNDRQWKRVTISLDYRDPPPGSLESELAKMKYQREKSAKIYETIRDSLSEISFYDTVTNLKLQTTEGRLHVHVVEDGNEIINYPSVDQIRLSGCKRIREKEIRFDCHMSGFVYKVRVHGKTLVKKEIPSPDTIDEFLYEVNALSNLRYSRHVVQLYGVVVDDRDEHVKGLLISYAAQGALIDIIYDNPKDQVRGITWRQRERWARQIVHGLADIHESGFVQGDFTLSNIVVNAAGNAKIIDINRRGCPVGWEPPELKTLVAAHRINIYIGVKSDLYQLGMVLWGLAMLEDEPELHPRPLTLRSAIHVPGWYRDITETCLSTDPRMRQSASSLLQMFPPDPERDAASPSPVYDAHPFDEDGAYEARTRQSYLTRTVVPSDGWPYPYPYPSRTYADTSPDMYEPDFPTRGRSPPSPLSRHPGGHEFADHPYSSTSWAANKSVRPSYSDIADEDAVLPNEDTVGTPSRPGTPSSLAKHDMDSVADIDERDMYYRQVGVLSRSLGDGLHMLSTPKLFSNDGTTLDPKLDREQPIASLRSNCLATVASQTAESVPHHATEQQSSNGPEIQTAEADLDGGVSLQPGIGLNGLGIAQIDARHDAAPGSQAVDENASCTRKVPSTEMEKATTHHPEPDSQTSPDFRITAKFKGARRRTPPFSRQRSLPPSLAGIGASLQQLEDEAKGKTGDAMEDDFNVLTRPATVQALMATTKSPR